MKNINKINMKKRVFRLTESQIDRLSKRFLKESYGLITYQDTICEIVCKEKVAKYGSKGDVVRMIQHLLYANQYNTKYAGGGMKGDFCYKDFRECDGIFKNQTKTAVEEFQRDAGIMVDGVVGYETWKAMCDNLTFTESLPKDKFCLDCPCDNNFQDDFKNIDVFDPIKSIDSVDCEKLKECVKEYIFRPAPDYIGFEKCIGGGDKQKIVNERDWTCKVCKDAFPTGYINKMPITNIDINDYNNYKKYLGDWCLSNCDGFKTAN
jgi:hypothetical protein